MNTTRWLFCVLLCLSGTALAAGPTFDGKTLNRANFHVHIAYFNSFKADRRVRLGPRSKMEETRQNDRTTLCLSEQSSRLAGIEWQIEEDMASMGKFSVPAFFSPATFTEPTVDWALPHIHIRSARSSYPSETLH